MAGARRRAQPRQGALHRVRPRQGAPNVGRVRRARLTAGVLRPVEVEAASERQRHALHRLVRERAVEPRRELEAATPATQAYLGSLPDDDESRPPQLEVVVVVEEPARDEDRAATLVRADDRDERAADELRAREAKPPCPRGKGAGGRVSSAVARVRAGKAREACGGCGAPHAHATEWACRRSRRAATSGARGGGTVACSSSAAVQATSMCMPMSS